MPRLQFRIVDRNQRRQRLHQISRHPLLVRARAPARIRPDRQLGEVDEVPHERPLERRVDPSLRIAIGIVVSAPPVEVHRHVHRLAAIGDEMAPIPDVPQRQLLPQRDLIPEIGDIARRRRRRQPGLQRPPHAEILPHLLEPVQQLIRQIARRILILSSRAHRRPLRRVERLARRRQRADGHGSAQHEPVVVDVDVMTVVPLGIVHRAAGRRPRRVQQHARGLALVGFRPELADELRRRRSAHERRQIRRQVLDRQRADADMAGMAPGERGAGGGQANGYGNRDEREPANGRRHWMFPRFDGMKKLRRGGGEARAPPAPCPTAPASPAPARPMPPPSH